VMSIYIETKLIIHTTLSEVSTYTLKANNIVKQRFCKTGNFGS